ncbi:hypothetical protein ACQPYE_06895 [Actinosynnema sp. CA-299493]
MDESLAPPVDSSLARLKPADPKDNRKLRIASWVLLAVGLLLTLVIAIVGSQGATLALLPALALTAASGLFQVMSVVTGNRAGKLDPKHVRTLVRDSISMQERMMQARVIAERGYENAKNQGDKSMFGQLSVNMSIMEDHLVSSIEMWRDLNPEIFEKGDDGGQD